MKIPRINFTYFKFSAVPTDHAFLRSERRVYEVSLITKILLPAFEKHSRHTKFEIIEKHIFTFNIDTAIASPTLDSHSRF